MWISKDEGAKFRLSVLTDLQNRGVDHIFIACIDGLKGFPEAINAMFSDANLMILSNKNNPIVEVDFRDLFPISLGSLDYNQNSTDVEYLTVTAEFTYQIYEFKTL